MQTLESPYGREPLTVDDAVPTIALNHWLGGVHVATDPAEVERQVRAKIDARKGDDGWTPALAEETVQAALWIHADNLAEYRWVMGGMR